MVLGLLLAQYYMKKTGRQSVIVWFLACMFFLSVGAIPLFGGLSLMSEID
mgnify:CR=1 FL=1